MGGWNMERPGEVESDWLREKDTRQRKLEDTDCGG